jgi:hypothetical protein
MIEHKAHQAENHHAKHDEVHLETLASGDDETADPGPDRHKILGGDGREP